MGVAREPAGFYPGALVGEGVRVGARRSRGKRAGCALEAGFYLGGWVEAGLEPRVSKVL